MIRTWLDRLYLFAGYAAGAFLVLIFAIMMYMSIGRQFGLNIPAGDDFASWAMCAMSFLGLAHTFKKGEIIRVGILLEQLTGKKRWALEILALQRHGAGRIVDPAMDPATRLLRRPGHFGDRADRRNGARAQGQQADLRKRATIIAG